MRTIVALLTPAMALLAAMTSPLADSSALAARKESGFVYVMTNEPSGNAVLQFSRSTSGQLTLLDQEPTGGLGGTTGGAGAIDPLASQDSLVVTADGNWLLAVNAGSNELSSLAATSSGLTLLSTVGSGGVFPNSVAVAGDLVYVLNAQGTPSVSGFRLNGGGALEPLAGSTLELPGGLAAAAHDIRFSPDRTRLLVTEDGTNQIDIFAIGPDGLIASVATEPSSGPAPFGIAFGRPGAVIVTEAAAGAVSSYRLTSAGTLDAINASVPTGQMASCWISLTGTGHAFISNTASATLSSYQVAASGHLSLVKAVAASTGPSSAPIDSALAGDGKHLYVLDSALGRVLIFGVNGNSLAAAGSVNGLPTTLQGIAAR